MKLLEGNTTHTIIIKFIKKYFMVYRIKGFGYMNEERVSNFLFSNEIIELFASAKQVLVDLLD